MSAEDKALQQSLLAEAFAAAPDDLDVLAAATYFCNKEASPCSALQATLRLAEQQPSNALNWALAVRDDDDAATRARLMAAAGAATMIEDHYERVMRLQHEALESSGVAVPPLLNALAEKLFPEVEPIELLVYLQSWHMPLPTWSAFARACRPDQPAADLAKVRQSCLNVGRLAAFQGRTLLTTMIGSAIVRHMVPGTEEALRARELRRHYVYVMDARAARTPAQIRSSREGLIGRELGQFAEIEVYKRSLDRSGVPRDPPADWAPDDPSQLMTAMERGVYRERQARLVQENLVPQAAQ